MHLLWQHTDFHDVHVRLLTEVERAELANTVLPTAGSNYVYGDTGVCWGCCHCTESMKLLKPRSRTIDSLMRRRELDKHLQDW